MTSVTTPTVGGDVDAWGPIVNTALTDLATAVTAVETGKLNLTGGTLTGPLVGTRFSNSGFSFGAWQPADHGFASWSYDPALVTNSSSVVNGTIYLTRVNVPADVTITKLYWWLTTSAVTPTAGQNWLGIYDSAGTRLAQTGVDGDVTGNNMKTVTISSTALTGGSFYWVALLFNAATPPTTARMSGLGGLATAANANLTASQYRFATNGTGATTLPATITPSSNTATGFAGPWVAVGV